MIYFCDPPLWKKEICLIFIFCFVFFFLNWKTNFCVELKCFVFFHPIFVILEKHCWIVVVVVFFRLLFWNFLTNNKKWACTILKEDIHHMYKEFELNLKKKMFRGYGKWTKWRACGYLSINPKAETHEKNWKKNVYEKERRENYRSYIIIIALGWVGVEAGTRDFFLFQCMDIIGTISSSDWTQPGFLLVLCVCVFLFNYYYIIIFIFFEFKQFFFLHFLFLFFTDDLCNSAVDYESIFKFGRDVSNFILVDDLNLQQQKQKTKNKKK